MIINTNISALSAKRRIHDAGEMKEKYAQRLSSGYKVNTAADDAASLAISEKMRAQIRGLNQAVKNIDDGINLFKTGDGALSEINNMIIRIKELAVQACNDTNEESDREKLDDEMQQLLQEIDMTSERTEFNKIKILKPEEPDLRIVQDTVVTLERADVEVYNALMGNFPMSNPPANTIKNRVESCNFPTTPGGVNSDNTTFYFSGITPNYAIIDVGYWVLHETPGFDNFVKNMYNDDGTISNTNMNLFAEYMIKGLNAGFKSLNGDIPELVGGFDNTGTLCFGFSDQGYQITSMNCSPASSTSIGHGFMHMMFTATNTSPEVTIEKTVTSTKIIEREVLEYPKKQMWIQSGANAFDGDRFEWETLGVEQIGLKDAKLTPWEEAMKTMKKVGPALNHSTVIRSLFGAYINRLEFAKQNSENMFVNSSASESRIRDADMAKEMMSFTKASILEQVGISMLTQANQTPQSVLQLIK